MIFLSSISFSLTISFWLASFLAKLDQKNWQEIKINGKEDQEIKKYLIDHVNKEEFIFSYKWDKGDIVVWDNLSIMHKASEVKNCTRVMHRITIK